ncbi:HD family phosphohydrolase [Rubrivirga litoralis]|uniref:HDIG domain-containing protein n=1 Tax=Rubrivirga litoralis TaxID=3075598 RepID=A0ABU3BUQ0_9BACT|nr:HDIG domain-containing metalloprotein [Rubrivirga sp. F394]MDT0633008.1 HDIG domain-containing protein [Rubrivirga sp. F394]
MAFLERIGLAPKSGRYSRRAGLRSDSRSPDDGRPETTRRVVLERVGLLAALAAIAMLAFPNVSVYDGTARVGDVWTAEDVVAPFDFPIRLPEDELRGRRDSVLQSEPPIFNEAPGALAQTLARLDSVDARLDSAFVAYAGWRAGRERLQADGPAAGRDPERAADRAAVRADSVRYAALRDDIRLSLSDAQWNRLLTSAYGVASGRASPPTLDDRLLGEAARIAREVLARGVLDVPIDSVRAPTLLVRNLDPLVRSQEERPRETVVGVGEAVALARRSLQAAFPSRPDTVGIGATLFRSAFEPSLLYDADATARARQATIDAVLPTRGRVRQDQVVVRRGDEVTPERYEQLRSLDLAQRERSGETSWARAVVGRLLLILSALVLFFLYVYLLRPGIFYDTRRLVLVCLILGMVLTGYLMAGAFGGAAPLVVPVALASILLTIVFDSRVGSFATMTMAALGGLVFGYDFPFAFATLIVGVLAVFSVRDVKNRSQLLVSAALVLTAYAIVLTGYALLRVDVWTARFTAELVAVAINAGLILFAGPLLWLIEKGFGVTTDMALLELSDTNRTLLKELSLKAPGTFNHSLQVANLAEAAADAVGANALRTRVGALYHDIGKMIKPEYFIENQQPGENPHERIKPSMSALVIAAHVKEGVQLGREQRLPTVVIDFIASHHGTGLIEFFYRRAQEQAEDPDSIDESDYRYPGPRPRTNEQAIVMLADSVEAASRSLEKPTPRRLESLIDGIVAARVADGQLDESSLTFSDLRRIKGTFHQLLCGIYHFRVKYPDQAEEPEVGAASGDGAAPEAEAADVEPVEEPASGSVEAPYDGPDEEFDGERPTSEERSTLG